jgi:hypothetical protein
MGPGSVAVGSAAELAKVGSVTPAFGPKTEVRYLGSPLPVTAFGTCCRVEPPFAEG